MKVYRYCPHIFEDDDNGLVVISHNLQNHRKVFEENLPWNKEKMEKEK